MRKKVSKEDILTLVDVQKKLFPTIRQGFMDDNIMKKLGMTQRVIRERELFLNQLLLPLCDAPLSGIQEEKLLPYYSEVEKWSNLYAY